MNSPLPNSPEDRLLDELLHEQHQGPDEAFLRQIEGAVDAGTPVLTKNRGSRLPARIAIAAAVTLAAGGAIWWQGQTRSRTPLAVNDSRAANEQANAARELERLNQAIRDQEDKVEERRKVLATIDRTKEITYQDHGPQVAEETIRRGLDAQDYADTRREYEHDRDKLAAMRTQQQGLAASVGNDEAKPNQTDSSIATAHAEIAPAARPAPSTYAAPSPPPIPAPAATQQPLPELAGNNRPEDRLDEEIIAVVREAESGLRAVEGGAGGTDAMAAKSRNAAIANSMSVLASPFTARSRTAPEPPTGDRYGSFIDQPWKSSASEPLSTFSIDVDTASYGNVRRMIREGREVPRDAVRIEECINAFSYRYDPPKGDAAFAVGASLAVCPWAPENRLARIAIKGREVDPAKRPASNLVFLIDVSGSMQSPDKLPMLKQSMATLVQQLDERDRVAMVVYAGNEGVALPSTRLDAEGRTTVLSTLSKLEAGGSTNGGAGIKRAYELAMKQKIEGGVNRVILATDGDFNVGVTGQGDLVNLVKERAKSGVYLTVLGFGTGNLNDSMMDAITRDGNGNYFYIDSEREGRKVFLQNLTGTLVTIAKDVKIQIEFNPAKVGSYRLIGYANRVLRNEDFSNDKVDAGDIGAGHTVTAFYELTPPGTGGTDLKYQAQTPPPANTNEWLTVKLRHKHPEGDRSSLTEFALTGDATALDQTDADFRFATAVALFGMKLRGMDEVRDTPWQQIIELARPGLANDAGEDRAEFVELVKTLGGTDVGIAPPPAEVMPGGNR